ncbi:hypothetical protein THAOC_12786 [Thalassiosira oceanica]|uniref:Sulfotransferase domain-containing protein n=1 Tax=Thalassiosira oceanica TaxID=159749 RepID=K0T788_THAOC|nr:hypothetical protein THAOC_12786 [Thalassiosira oceanica]|eukprot:EJK66302.1 hypothetical protein THAOC_12786 [Thalassiosira oceanica]
MKVYGSTEEEARAGANVTPPACRLPESKVWLNTYAERDEPAVHLHIGPHKTGTTALQAFIYDTLHANETLFLEDNIRVPKYEELPGTFAKEGVGLNLAHCCIIGYKGEGGGQMNCPMCSRMRDEFPLFMIDAWQKGQDVLIAAEDFDRKEIDFERLECLRDLQEAARVAPELVQSDRSSLYDVDLQPGEGALPVVRRVVWGGVGKVPGQPRHIFAEAVRGPSLRRVGRHCEHAQLRDAAGHHRELLLRRAKGEGGLPGPDGRGGTEQDEPGEGSRARAGRDRGGPRREAEDGHFEAAVPQPDSRVFGREDKSHVILLLLAVVVVASADDMRRQEYDGRDTSARGQVREAPLSGMARRAGGRGESEESVPEGRAEEVLRLAKALDRGKGQNWQTLRFNFGMADRPREKRVEGREWSGSPYARPIATSPLGVDRSAHLQRDYSTLSVSVSSAGTTTIGRVELLHGLPWAIRMALRPPLSIKRAGATANLCIIARARPAEVSEPLITSLLWKPAATEVRCGIELSLCSAACPSGTIYTSFWPDICAGLLGGSSAAPLSVGLPFEFGFADQTTPLPR